MDVDMSAGLSSGVRSAVQRARLRNISRGGANFVSDEPVSRGERIEIKLGDGLCFRGEVIRAEPSFAGGFAVRFTEERRERRSDVSTSAGPEAGADNGGPHPGRMYQLELKSLKDEAFWYYERLERVREYVTANYSEPISLETAAGIAAMERTYFSHFFRQKVGVTFSSWLQYVRIGAALEMIKERDHSITDVAFSVGFNELSTFQKAFKRWTNLTPRDFKRLARPS
jgi:AraC-like DNA-binding protein